MESIAHSRSYDRSRLSRRHRWRLCLVIVGLLSLVGCVAKSKYETVATEMEALRADLVRAQEEIRTLEQQKDALHQLTLKGERLLTGIKAELQQARASYAEYKAEQNRLGALKAKAHELQNEHRRQIQAIKAAKREELKMQAVIERYEREMTQVPEVGDMLRISQAADTAGGNSRLVATVTPLPPDHSSAMNSPSNAPVSTPSSAPQVSATAVIPPAPSSITPAPAPTPSAQPAVAPAPPAAMSPNPQPAPAEESWLGSVTGWLSSLWGWLFS